MALNESLKSMVTEEIALDGLEGITFIDLCLRIGNRMNISNQVPQKIKDHIWSLVLTENELEFYVLPIARPCLTILDRAAVDLQVQQSSKDPNYRSELINYRYQPIVNENEKGSCEFYETRVRYDKAECQKLSSQELIEKFAQTFVIVASQNLRNMVLGLHDDKDLSLMQYCILERIGRSREIGECLTGSYSLQNILTTDKHMSGNYLMKLLVTKNLVTKQEYRFDGSTKYIYHLPKFYKELKPKLTVLMERGINFLKTFPNGMAKYSQVRASLMTDEGQASRVFKHPDFRKATEKLEIPYRQMYPDAHKRKWQTKNKAERVLQVIKLKDPSIETYSFFVKKPAVDLMTADDEQGLLDTKNQCYDMPLLRQLLKFFHEKGETGVKQLEVQQYFGLSRLNARNLIKVFEKFNLTDSFMVDEGRQRTRKLVLKKYLRKPTQNANETTLDVEVVEPSLEDDHDILNITDKIQGYDTTGMDLSLVDATMTFMKTCPKLKPEKSGIRLLLQANTLTTRTVKRCHLILKLLQIKKVVSAIILLNSIKLSEKRLGYKDFCDRKTLFRLLGRLAIDELLKIFELKVTVNDKVSSFIFACDIALDASHELIQSTIDSYKAKLTLKQVYEDKHLKKDRTLSEIRLPNEKNSRKILLQYISAPKFIRMRNLHEYLFYLLYGLKEYKKPLTKERVIEQWAATYPEIDMTALADELPNIYSQELDWRAFIEPYRAQIHPGWGFLNDIILRMPLAIMLTLIKVEFKLPELREIMLHPVKRYLTVAQSPASVRALLTYRRTYTYSVHQTAMNLAYIGALQFGTRRSIEKDQIYVYLNRNVALLDTTTSDPAYHKISKKKYPERVYRLNNLDDLQKYWSDMYLICQETKLNSRSYSLEEVVEAPGSKEILQKCVEQRSHEEMLNYDDGTIPGDQLGAGGLDSSLFAHLKTNWMKGKPTVRKAIRSRLLSKIKKDKKKGLGKKKDRLAASKKRSVIARPSIKGRKHLRITPGKRIRLPKYDDVDRTALKLMNKLRVDWKEEEDHTLLVCKLALLYLNPPFVCGVTFQAIRDILHFKHPTCINKTTKACQRRINYVLKHNPETRHILAFCLEELKQNEEIENRFGENFLETLRQFYKKDDDFQVAVKIHFVTLVYLLDSCYKNLATNQFLFKEIILPDAIQEFNNEFILSHFNSKQYVDDPISEEGVQTMMMDAVIHSSMCCMKDKTTWNFQLFDIYKNYPDELLKQSIKGLRQRQVLSANKSVKTKRLHEMPISGCPFHLSQNYVNQICTKFSYDAYSEAFGRFLEIGHETMVTGSGWYSFKTFDIGSILFFAEISNKHLLEVKLELPRIVIQIDRSKQENLPEGGLPKIHAFIKRLEQGRAAIYEAGIDSNDEEDSSTLELKNSKKKQLRFNEEETYKYDESPAERLLKLDYTYYHFFCLLGSLKNISPTFSINEDKTCPLNCVISQPDPIDCCIKIAAANKDTIKSLLNKTTSPKPDYVHKTYVIKEDTLMCFFQRFIEQWKIETQASFDKDTGKMPEKVQSDISMLELANHFNLQSDTKLHFWIKPIETFRTRITNEGRLDLTKSILTSEKSKKDDLQDNVHRYHELFNINIGKLGVTLSESSDKSLVKFDNFEIPKCLMLISTEKKDNLIKKIKSSAIWPVHVRNVTELRKALKSYGLSESERKLAENILEQIKQFGNIGTKSQELYSMFSHCDKQTLQKVMNALCAADFILRTGVCSVVYVHWTCIKPWLVRSYNLKRLERESIPLESLISGTLPSTSTLCESDSQSDQGRKRRCEDYVDLEATDAPVLKRSREDYVASEPVSDFVDRENIFMIPQPWIRVNGTLNRRALDKWMGTVLFHVLQFPGMHFLDLCNRFNILTPFQIRKILEFFVDLDCIQLFAKCGAPVTLFSEVDDFRLEPATDFHPAESITIQPMPDAITKFSIFLGNKKYSSEFI